MKRLILIFTALLLAALCACGTQAERPSVYDTEYEGRVYSVDLNQQTIAFDGVVCTFEIVDGSVFQVTYPDGSTYWRNASGDNGCSDDYDGERYAPGDALWCAVFGTSQQTEGGEGRWLIGLLCVGVGVFYIVSPRKAWRWRYSWRRKEEEPTAKALEVSRGMGILCVIVGIVLFFL